MIKKLKVENFKSFEKLNLELEDLCVFIGSNASGKTNLVQALRFLKNISSEGLENAVSLFGRIEYLRNFYLDNKFIELALEVDERFSIWLGAQNNNGLVLFEVDKINFTLRLECESQTEFKIEKNPITLSGNIYSSKPISKNLTTRYEKENLLGRCQINFNIVNQKLQPEIESTIDTELDISHLLVPFENMEFTNKTSILRMPFINEYIGNGFFSKIFILNLEPKLLKKESSLSGRNVLEEDGANLVFILRGILGDEKKKRKFLNLLSHLLGFVKDIVIEEELEKLMLNLREDYNKEVLLPSFLMSDGTMNVIGLIVALYFDERSVLIIEEPDRNLHPSLLSKLAEMIVEVSERKQIIVTSHNPLFLRNFSKDNIYCVKRDRNGFSQIFKANDSETFKRFLEDDFGLDELMTDNLIESILD